jgi:transmembrane sensor
MEQAYIQSLLQRYQDGLCTPAERQAVEQWYEALGSTPPALTPAQQQQLGAAMWARIAAETVEAAPVQRQLVPESPSWWQASPWRWAAAAALVLGGAVGTMWLRPATLDEVANIRRIEPTATAAGEWVVQPNNTTTAARISLGDGSVVTLAPASSLRYPRHFDGPKRKVYLSGEAFFSVAHNAAQPFQVYTDKVITTVLGTSFTVRAFAGQPAAQVEVRTGRVRVTPVAAAPAPGETAAALPASVVVLPNQKAEYAPAAHELTTALVAEPAVLSEQPLVFDDRPVAEVFAALEKAYGVAIDYDHAALANCTVSLVLRQETLFGKLDLLCKTLSGSYRQEGTRIVVKARGCPKD